MKLHALELRNYRRFADVRFEPGDGVTALIGRNGAGKSTLLEALGFALFGPAAARTAKALLRGSGAPSDPVEVRLEMELGGQAIEIERSLRGKNLTPHASLTIDGAVLVAPGGNSNGAVTAEVERLLGMDRRAFFTTIVAQQKDLSRLADLPGPERRQMILRMLGVDALDVAIQKARENRRDAEVSLAALRSALDDTDLGARAKQLDLDEAEAKQRFKQATQEATAAETAMAEASATLRAVEQAAAAYARLQEQLREATRAAAQANEEVARRAAEVAASEQAVADAEALTPEAAKLPAAERAWAEARAHAARHAAWMQAKAQAKRLHKRRAEAQEALQELVLPELPAAVDVGPVRARLSAAQAHVASTDAEQRRLQNQLRRIQDTGPCPLCLRPLDDHAAHLRERLEADLRVAEAAAQTAADDHKRIAAELTAAEAIASLYETTKRQIERVTAERRQLEQTVAQCERDLAAPRPEDPGAPPDVAALEQAKAQAQASHVKREQALATAQELPARQGVLLESKREYELAQQSHEALQKQVAETPDPTPALEQAHLAQAAAARTDKDLATALARAMAALDAIGEARKHLDEARVARKRQQDAIKLQQDALTLWTALAGGRGHGLLERFRAHLIGKIRPGINREASRLLAAFTNGRYTEVLLDEDYGLFVSDGGVPYALERFSGGENDLVHLALRIAVSRLLARRAGAAELRFLALDEVFGSLDRQRRDAVLAALQPLTHLYAQVLLVTHQDDMRDALDHVVEVVAEDDSSTLRVHQG